MSEENEFEGKGSGVATPSDVKLAERENFWRGLGVLSRWSEKPWSASAVVAGFSNAVGREFGVDGDEVLSTFRAAARGVMQEGVLGETAARAVAVFREF